MARSTLLRVTLGSAVAVLATVGMTGCIGGPGTPTASPTASTSTPTATPTPTPTATPTTPPSTPTAPPSTPTTPPVESVSVQILNAAFDPSTSTVSVAGQVVGLVSDSGTCTATASQDGQSVTAQSAGMANTAETYCSDLTLALPAGSTGTWTIDLAFADATHSGSVSGTVEVG
ncbi:hypothetical protein [Herbiconiux daphne]|uniref:Uncharacterized protein n=1 Tax=Herbiconiux daphne TaxID=2970914 RepID=A0ABT2H4M3_9MICO|nr:hypothetical protein [Herbiconiux daphne]MCS5734890.1 hypothetical protein [Herbiconiux daphne]